MMSRCTVVTLCNKQIVVMKKNFRIVMALALTCGALSFTGCTDYEDDINSLGDRVTAVENALSELQSKIDGGAVITNVAQTADGVTITLSDGQTYNITNGKDGAAGEPGSVVTIGENGNWFIDGVDTGNPSKGDKGDKGDTGATGPEGPAGPAGPAGDAAPTVYYKPNMETGCWDKVTVDPETGKETVEATTDSWKAAGITAVWDTESGKLTITGVEGAENGTIEIWLYPGRLSSITLIPEVYLDGVPAIQLNSYSYMPQTVTSNATTETVANKSGATTQTTAAASKTVRYHVSPSTVTKSDIGDPTYLIESALMLTTRSGNEPVINVVGYDIDNAKKELLVTIKKAAGVNLSENPKGDDYIYTAALEVPVTRLYNGEDPFSVYSEYSALVESSVEPQIAALIDESKDQDEYACEKDAHSHFYPEYDDVAVATVAVNAYADFDKPFDLLSMVTGCYTDEKGAVHEITKATLEEAGLEFEFAVPTKPFATGDNDTDQQKFARVDGTDLIAVTPEGLTGNRATIGKTPVVRAELIDVNNDNAIVDVVYFKIQWSEEALVPEDEDLGNIATFEYDLSCADFEDGIDWETMVNDILAKVNNGNGLSYEEFVARYQAADVTATYTAAANSALVGDDATVVASWDNAGSYEPNAAAFTWTMTPAEIGDLLKDAAVEDLTKGDEIGSYTVNIELDSSVPGEGSLNFQFTLSVKCPVLPKIEDYAPGYWDTEGELLRVYPLQITDKYWDGQTMGNYTVEYNYPFMEQFEDVNNDGIFLTNIAPTTAHPAAEWGCRRWDVQYSDTQKYLPAGYAPQFPVGDLYAGTNDGAGYHIYNGNEDAAHIWWTNAEGDLLNTPENWYEAADITKIELRLPLTESAKQILNENRTTSVANADFAAGNLKTAAIDIWARINAYNVCKVKTVNVWFVNPLTIDAVVEGEFTDAIYGGSKVSVEDAFDSVSDFLGNKVNVYTGGSGAPEDLRKYYDVKTPEWHVEDALISINKNTNDIDNTLDPNKPADLAKMSLLTDRFTQVSLREEGSDLVFYNEGGAAVTEVMYIWVPVSVEHKWGVWEYYAPIKLNPNPNTAGE